MPFKPIKSLVLTIVWTCSALLTVAQIELDSKQSAQFYVTQVLLGSGVEVGPVEHIGMIGGLGQFDAQSSIIGVNSGLILSTGNIDSINGPNDNSGYTSSGTMPSDRKLRNKLRKGDKDLNKLCRRRTVDVTVIEFDFVPVKNKLKFNYVFASEEYKEWVGSPFNDVFGFFLSGPGIEGKKNLAVLPNKKESPISVSTINQRKRRKYWRSNGGMIRRIGHMFRTAHVVGKQKSQKKIDRINSKLMTQVQFDGLTVVLTVDCDVIPYQKYRMKIAIGDASDRAYDSAVFLEAGSFVSVEDPEGQYYDTLQVLEAQHIDVDSVLSGSIAETSAVVIDTVEVPVINEEFEITDIYFDHSSSELEGSFALQLDKLAYYLNRNEELTCSLYGYADNSGSKKYNQKLSGQRALAVMNYLIGLGVDSKRLDYRGNSSHDAKYDNVSEEGKAKNRRVEVVIQ
jgi:outer membrane protein OmpA-like peptidoglycan-associated protein